jgi:hypothetical protein
MSSLLAWLDQKGNFAKTILYQAQPAAASGAAANAANMAVR